MQGHGSWHKEQSARPLRREGRRNKIGDSRFKSQGQGTRPVRRQNAMQIGAAERGGIPFRPCRGSLERGARFPGAGEALRPWQRPRALSGEEGSA
jgi:hypothetical protein